MRKFALLSTSFSPSSMKDQGNFEYMKDKLTVGKETKDWFDRCTLNALCFFSLHKWDSIPATYCVHLMVVFIFNWLWLLFFLLEKILYLTVKPKYYLWEKKYLASYPLELQIFRAFCNIKKFPLEVWELFWSFKQNDNLTLPWTRNQEDSHWVFHSNHFGCKNKQCYQFVFPKNPP